MGHFANEWPIAALWLIVPAAGFSMSLSPAEIGLLFSLFSVGAALAYVPAGLVADHINDRGRLFVGTFVWVAIGCVFVAFSQGFCSLAIFLALLGMGNAARHPTATGVLTSTNKITPARALGVYAVGVSVAEVLAPLSVGLLLSVLDRRGVLAGSMLPTALIGLCILWVARAIPAVENQCIDREDLMELLRAWRGPDGVQLVATLSLCNMALIGLLSMIPLYPARAHALAPGTIGMVFAAIRISGALAQPWVGTISDSVGRLPVLAIGNGLAALAVATPMFELPFWSMIATMALRVASLYAIRPVMLIAAVERASRMPTSERLSVAPTVTLSKLEPPLIANEIGSTSPFTPEADRPTSTTTALAANGVTYASAATITPNIFLACCAIIPLSQS